MSFGIEGIYIVAPDGANDSRTLPGTCLKPGYFGLSESHYLDLGDEKDNFEKAIRKNSSKNYDEITRILEKSRVKKEGLSFSDIIQVSKYSKLKIKCTAIVGENGSGKSQLLQTLKHFAQQINRPMVSIITDQKEEGFPVIGGPGDRFKFLDHGYGIIIGKTDVDIHTVISTHQTDMNSLSLFAELFKEGKGDSYILKKIINRYLLKSSENLDIINLSVQLSSKRFVNFKNILSDLENRNPISNNNITINDMEKFKIYSRDQNFLYLYGYLCILGSINGISLDEKKYHNKLNFSLQNFYNIQTIAKKIAQYLSDQEKERLNTELKNELNTYNPIFQKMIEKVVEDEGSDTGGYLEAFTEIQNNIRKITRHLSQDNGKVVDRDQIKIKLNIDNCEKLFKDELFATTNLPSHTGYNFRNLFEILEISDLTINGINNKGLSAGEKSMFNRLCDIIGKIKETGVINNLLLLIDEPDAFLHIRRQKEYIGMIIEFLDYLQIQTHIVIATHSPFIVSDIPENNLLILDQGKDVTNKYVKGGDKKNTFASTTFDIVSDYMGMINGRDIMIGDFTKEIIDGYVKKMKELLIKKRNRENENINDQANNEYPHQGEIEKLQTDYSKIIDGIGDPILKEYLLLMHH